jgi:DNA-binding beta-propeller fold protein YncE
VTVFDPDGSSLRVTREVTVAPELDGIDATETGSTVWAFSRQTRTLYRIANAAQPAVTGTVVLRSAPVAIALSGQSIWVATQDGNLTELRQ